MVPDLTLGHVCANIRLLITQMRCGVCSAGGLFGLMLSEEPFALLWAAPAQSLGDRGAYSRGRERQAARRGALG